MKLFLTSAGLTNQTLISSFEKLVNLPKDQIKIAFIPTAANFEPGDKGWLIDDCNKLKKLGYYVDIVDISSLPIRLFKPRLDEVNVLFFGGGNTEHLMYWVEKSGLNRLIPKYLNTKIYAGISAGSCLAAKTINNPVQDLYDEPYEFKVEKGLGLINFQVVPHYNSDFFPKIRDNYLEEASKRLTESIYAIDDNSAIAVEDSKIKVVSEGFWKKFNG